MQFQNLPKTEFWSFKMCNFSASTNFRSEVFSKCNSFLNNESKVPLKELKTSFFIIKWITFLLTERNFKEMSTKDFYRKVEEFHQFLITLYLLLILFCHCEKHKKSYIVSKLFRFLFAVFSGFCLLLFTFRLYQCFRILSLAFMECLLSTFLLFFYIVLLFVRWRYGFGNLKQVHWRQKHHTETEPP